ncbi:hypothetical protein CGCF413_v007361 [Colletotrichum fructicola]|nr:hypothetical protein CGCF413_v007361 [Colletotrichum fructicola]
MVHVLFFYLSSEAQVVANFKQPQLSRLSTLFFHLIKWNQPTPRLPLRRRAHHQLHAALIAVIIAITPTVYHSKP